MENSDYEDVYISYLKKPGDFPACHAIFPTQTMHHHNGTPSKWSYICMVWSLQNGWLTDPWVTYLSGEWNNNDKRDDFNVFYGRNFPHNPTHPFGRPASFLFPPGVTWKYLPSDGWKNPCRGEGEENFMSTGFEREASPKSWEEEVGVWVNFLGWVPLWWVFFFFFEFLGLGFFGGEKIGAFSEKKAYENKESERIKHCRHLATHSWGVLCFFVLSAISLEVMAVLKWIFSRVAASGHQHCFPTPPACPWNG